MDNGGIYVVIRHLNVQRERHGAGSLVCSHECSRRAQDLVNREIAYPGSVISAMMNVNGAACFGQNLAVRVEGISPAAACIRAIDMWQVEQSHYDFANPGYSPSSRHFAANVWRSMTHVGIGVGDGRNGGYTIAAVFYQPTMAPMDFGRNVLPARSETLRHGLGVLPSNPRPRSGSPPAPSFLTAPSSVCVRGDSVEIKELRSNDGRFRFVMQPEQRNLALYMEDDAVWAIYLTSPHPAPATSEEGDDSHDRLVLLSDGNLVAMDCSLRHVWSSNTANAAPGPYTLTLQDDGDCVLFAGGGVRLWATGTAGWG